MLLTDLKGNSSSLDIIGNVLESLNMQSQQGQAIREENDTPQLKIALPLSSGRHLYEFDTYHKDQPSHFDSCLAPFSEQLQVCFPPSTGPQQLVQSVCTNSTIFRETTTENQGTSSAITGTDVIALAKAAVEAAKHAAALVEALPLAEAIGQKGFVLATEPLYPSNAEIDMLENSQTFEVTLAREKVLKLDDQHSLSSMSIPVNKENVKVSSNRQIERTAKRDRVSRKVKESASGISSLRVHRKGKKPLSACYDPKDPRPSVLVEPGSQRLLSAREEVELSKRVQDLLNLDEVKILLQEGLGREPTMLEWAKAVGIDKKSLTSRVKVGWRCKDKMMKRNSGLVISIANSLKGFGMSLPDLIQVGNSGLIRGIEKFDYKLGYKFSTYAYWWIRQSMTKALSQHSRTIRLPENVIEIMSRIKEAKSLFYQANGRHPSNEEVAEVVGITVDRLRKVLKDAKIPRSIDCPVGKDQDRTLGEIVGKVDDESLESISTRQSLKQDIDNLLRTLSSRQREIIRLRYGLVDGRPRTLSEVCDTYNVSRERIRQVESTTLTKLKKRGKVMSCTLLR